MTHRQMPANQHSTSLHTFSVHFPAPLDIPASLELFRRWGDDGLDRWDGLVFIRTAWVRGESVPFACTVIGTVDKPAMDIAVPEAEHLPAVQAVVERMFVTAPESLQALMTHDPIIAELESRFRGVRPVVQCNPFTALIRSISAQQVNLNWATTVRRRLAETFGQRLMFGDFEVLSLGPESLAEAEVATLRELQFTVRKSEYIIGLAQAVAGGQLDLDALHDAEDAEVIASLTALRGLGVWTAEWFLARTLGRPRVSAGDLGVRKAIGKAYLDGHMPSVEQVRELTAHWGEAAGVAQQLVLHALSVDT